MDIKGYSPLIVIGYLNVKIIVRVKSLDILCLKVHQTTFIYPKL